MNTEDMDKRYIRISSDSGCFLANYKPMADSWDSLIIVDTDEDKSGVFKMIHKL